MLRAGLCLFEMLVEFYGIRQVILELTMPNKRPLEWRHGILGSVSDHSVDIRLCRVPTEQCDTAGY
jgi:hypothetical protein